MLGQFFDGEFNRVAEVDRAAEVVISIHQADKGLDEVIDIAERTGLQALSVDGYGHVLQGLDNEIRDDPAVVRMHARPVGIEDPPDFNAQVVLPVIVEKEGFGAALAFIVTRTGPGRIDVAPVALRLRMDIGIAVHLARRGLENLGPYPFCQTQHIDGTMHTGLGGLYRVMLIMDRRGRAGQIVDLIDLNIEREGDVVAHQLEVGIIKQVQDVILIAGKIVIDAQNIVPVLEQTFAEMGTEKSGPSGYQYSFCAGKSHCSALSIKRIIVKYQFLETTGRNHLIKTVISAGYIGGIADFSAETKGISAVSI